MRIPPDSVPRTHEEAVGVLLRSLDAVEVEAIVESDPADVHHTVGQLLRNSWSLWDRNTVLVQHYKARGVVHADDISALILGDLFARVKAEPFDFDARVREFQEHWRKHCGSDFPPG